MDLGLSISEGEKSIEDFQNRQPDVNQLQRATDLPNEFESLAAFVGSGAIAESDVTAILFQADIELDSRCCPDTSVPSGEDLPPFFNESSNLKPATELAVIAELPVLSDSQQTQALAVQGDDAVFRFWMTIFTTRQLQGQQHPINILERHTQMSVYQSLWWNNSMLLTGATNFCEAAALFNITFVKPYREGYIVQLVALSEDKLLCADCTAKEPVFVLLSTMDARRPAIQRQYRLGPGNSQYKSFHFQHPSTKDWYYWLIEGKTVVLRKQSYVDSKQLEVQLFFTKPGPECK